MATTNTKSTTSSELAQLRMEIAELRAAMLPLAVPNLKELGQLHQSLCRSIRRELPGEADAEMRDAFNRLDAAIAGRLEELPTLIVEHLLGDLLRSLPGMVGPFLPLLMQLPGMGDIVQRFLVILQSESPNQG